MTYNVSSGTLSFYTGLYCSSLPLAYKFRELWKWRSWNFSLSSFLSAPQLTLLRHWLCTVVRDVRMAELSIIKTDSAAVCITLTSSFSSLYNVESEKCRAFFNFSNYEHPRECCSKNVYIADVLQSEILVNVDVGKDVVVIGCKQFAWSLMQWKLTLHQRQHRSVVSLGWLMQNICLTCAFVNLWSSYSVVSCFFRNTEIYLYRSAVEILFIHLLRWRCIHVRKIEQSSCYLVDLGCKILWMCCIILAHAN